MSFYAYEDEGRVNEVLAADVNINNKLDEYFCPTPNCTARLGIRNMQGERTAHFAARPLAPHSGFCRINRHTINPTQYDETQFNIDDFMNHLFKPENQNNENGNGGHRNGNGRIRPISTVRQLYSICIQKSIHQTYNHIEVSQLLVDRRTRHIYYLFIRGNHLVECQFWRYDSDNMQCYAKYWLNDNNDDGLTIRLDCRNRIIFDKLLDNKIFRNRILHRNIVVAGNWRTTDHICIADIVNLRQVYTFLD